MSFDLASSPSRMADVMRIKICFTGSGIQICHRLTRTIFHGTFSEPLKPDEASQHIPNQRCIFLIQPFYNLFGTIDKNELKSKMDRYFCVNIACIAAHNRSARTTRSPSDIFRVPPGAGYTVIQLKETE
ncbi:hypothetical protein [Desulfovibrio sp. UIB00]|uniref:hypothetical protein n=1 Tax=Desulfovibrio sp. UIB00 TaxID=2804314 RepID=UPI001F0E3F92|nr:hypothetical protein [Desulfovibrio sp. UIB00]